MNLIETTVPKTSHGREYGEWAKLLFSVDPKARDGYGFEGDWLQRGIITELLPGAVVLECAGYRTHRDQEDRRDRLYVLWKFTDEHEWVEVARSKERAWAQELRGPAATALEEE
jgi:hypothetical protein